MLTRVLSVLAAIVLIGGALYVRGTVIDPQDSAVADGGGTDGATGEDRPDPSGDLGLRVACDATLADACPSGATILDGAGMLAAFQAQPVEFDALVAPSAVVALIEDSRTSRVSFADDRPVAATTALVLAVATSRDEVVADACGAGVTWRCAADLIRADAIVPSFSDPVDTSVGLAAFAALTGGFLDSTTYSTNVLGGADFFSWLDAVQGQVTTVSDPLGNLILFNAARNDSAVVLEATAVEDMARAASAPDLYWPTPLATLQVVAAGVDGVDVDALADVARDVGTALTAAGWRGPDGAPVPAGAPTLDPADDGLPAGGVLFSLRDLWG